MELQEIKDEVFYVLVAKDGNPQLATLSPDFETCVGMVELMASRGISRPLGFLFEEGYEIIPIKLSVISNGTAEEGFKNGKQKL